MILPAPGQILRTAGVTFTSFTHPPIRTHEDIERVLKLPPDRLLKTMAFRAGDGFVLASLPIVSRVAYGPLAKAVGMPRSRLRQAGPEDLGELQMEPGGISPLTNVPGVQVVFDSSVTNMTRVYCGSGRNNETLELEATDLIDIVQPLIAKIVNA